MNCSNRSASLGGYLDECFADLEGFTCVSSYTLLLVAWAVLVADPYRGCVFWGSGLKLNCLVPASLTSVALTP